jgi:hypothetical protein
MIQTFRFVESQNLNRHCAIIDPIPGPETIRPSLDGPDMGVYLYEVGSFIDSIKLQSSETPRFEIL